MRPFGPDSTPTESQTPFELGSTIPFMISFTVPIGARLADATVAVAALVVPAAACRLVLHAARTRAIATGNSQ
jgi:hypothetical protein